MIYKQPSLYAVFLSVISRICDWKLFLTAKILVHFGVSDIVNCYVEGCRRIRFQIHKGYKRYNGNNLYILLTSMNNTETCIDLLKNPELLINFDNIQQENQSAGLSSLQFVRALNYEICNKNLSCWKVSILFPGNWNNFFQNFSTLILF